MRETSSDPFKCDNMDIKKLNELGIPYDILVLAKYKKLKENVPIEKTLSDFNPKYKEIYVKYINLKVRTGDGKLLDFDRDRIKKSLLRETNISVEEAVEISKIVEKEIFKLDLDDLNTSLIRDIVNLILLKKGMLNIRKQYLRIGIPSYDLEKYIKNYQEEKIYNKIMSDLVLSRYLPKNLVISYLKNDLYFHGLNGFLNKVFCYELDIYKILKKGLRIYVKTKPPKDPFVFINQMMRALRYYKKFVIDGFLITNFHFKISPFLNGNTTQVSQFLLYELNTNEILTNFCFRNEDDQNVILPGGKKLDIDYNNYLEKAKEFLNSFENLKNQMNFVLPIITKGDRKIYKKFVLDLSDKGIGDVVSINLLKLKNLDDEQIFENLEKLVKYSIEYFDLKTKYFVGNKITQKISKKYPYFINLYGIFEFDDVVLARRVIRFIKKEISGSNKKIKLSYFVNEDIKNRFGYVCEIKDMEKINEILKVDRNIIV